MASNVQFQDFSFEVKAELNTTSIGWLYAWAGEIASHAQRHCVSTFEDKGKQLKGSYGFKVNEKTGVAQIGSPMEAAYWEEFGTGSWADTSKNGGREGRPGWWVYTPGSTHPEGKKSNTYYDEMEAMMMAAYIQERYNKKAYISNGQKPNYTLEKAFNANKEKAEANLDQLMKERMGT